MSNDAKGNYVGSNDVIGLLGPLRRYACSLTRDESAADDLVHDALVRAYERRNQKLWGARRPRSTIASGANRRSAP